MPRDCCDKSNDKDSTAYKSIWVKDPVGDYGGEPSYLSAETYNTLLYEMNYNKALINSDGTTKVKVKPDTPKTNVAISNYVSSGQVLTASAWNAVCDQIAGLINAAKASIAHTKSETTLNVSAAEAQNYKYSSGEVIRSSKRITHLINLVRRARIRCSCHVHAYTPCNFDCKAHHCHRDSCCDRSND